MALMQARPPRTQSLRRPPNELITGPTDDPFWEARSGRRGMAQTRRPGPSRPPGAPLRYAGSGVRMSTASHRRSSVTPATTVGLALLAALTTLWLGLVGHFGAIFNADTSDSAPMPDSLAVVRVEAGESLRDVAARVAPDAPVRQVVDRIRALNALDSTVLAAGQTLIAPVG